MKMQTPSPMPYASPSRRYASGSVSPGSSPPSPASGITSTPPSPPRPREQIVGRAPGMSVRLKLTLSYAGFLMLAGSLMLAAIWLFFLRYVPSGAIYRLHPSWWVRIPSDPLNGFGSVAAIVLGCLLIVGLLGGWFLAGRMLSPLARVTDATRRAASGSLSHRIQLPGRSD